MNPMVITCQVMESEFRALMPPGTGIEVFAISEHVRPERLRALLQQAIARADGHFDPIYLGYGLCSQAVVGLVAHASHLAVFRTDDCIGVFLGSRQARRQLADQQPGSYFLSRGWIGNGSGSVFDEYPRLEQKWGPDRALKLMQMMLEHYTQLVHILLPGAISAEEDRLYTRQTATHYGLNYLEVAGSCELIKTMIANGDHPDIALFTPGQPVTLDAMLAP